MSWRTQIEVQLERLFLKCMCPGSKNTFLNKMRGCLSSAGLLIVFYYLLDVTSSSISIATYYRTTKSLGDYAYAYNLVFYPILFSIVIWTVYIITHYSKKLKTMLCPPKKKTIYTNPILHEVKGDSDDSGDEMSSYDVPMNVLNEHEMLVEIEPPQPFELPLWQDIKLHFKIYMIMALADTMTGLLILPATLYLPSVDVLLFGRVVLIFNMFFCWCIFKRKYNILHFIAVLLLIVGIGFAVLPSADLSIELFLGNITLTNSTSSSPSGKGIFFSLLALILVVEFFAALSSVYKEYVLQQDRFIGTQKYRLQALRTVAIVATIQPIFSSPTLMLLSLPLPKPWFYVPLQQLGPYIYQAAQIPFISLNMTNGVGLPEELTSNIDSYFLLFYAIYLGTNVLANVVDVIFTQTVSSTFNIVVNVTVIVASVFSLSWPLLAGEAQTIITWDDGLALFFVVIATIQFKAGSDAKYDTVDPIKKTAVQISRHVTMIKEEKPKEEVRHYDLRDNIENIVHPPSQTYMRKTQSKTTVNPFLKTTNSMTTINLEEPENTPRSVSVSNSESEADDDHSSEQ